MYFWQSIDWPHFRYDVQVIEPALTQARLAQGRMLGLASALQLVELGEKSS